MKSRWNKIKNQEIRDSWWSSRHVKVSTLINKKEYNTTDPYIYNSFVDTPMILNDPIKRLNTLTISIVGPDNTYYDFNGLDHTFNLEIVTFDEIPEATSLI